MNFEIISDIAKEHRFEQIPCETSGMVSFARAISKGRIRINFAERQQIITLIIRKENVKGFKNLLITFHPIDYQITYNIFHKPNSFRNAK